MKGTKSPSVLADAFGPRGSKSLNDVPFADGSVRDRDAGSGRDCWGVAGGVACTAALSGFLCEVGGMGFTGDDCTSGFCLDSAAASFGKLSLLFDL